MMRGTIIYYYFWKNGLGWMGTKDWIGGKKKRPLITRDYILSDCAAESYPVIGKINF